MEILSILTTEGGALPSLPDGLIALAKRLHQSCYAQYQERAGLIMTDLIQQVELHNPGLEEEGSDKSCNKSEIR